MTRLVRLATLGVVSALALAHGGPARADFLATVTPTITPSGGGLSLFSYAVNVLPTSTTSLTEFDLNLSTGVTSGIFTPTGATITPVAMPNGFINTYTPGDPVIMYQSTDASTDVAPGATGVFSFLAAAGSTMSQPFQFIDGAGGTITGATLAPVPEPASLTLMGLGVAGVVGYYARGRRRAA